MSLDIDRIRRDYGDVDAEADACRHAAALFDFSFVARARVEGPGALRAISALTARPLADMCAGDIRYALRCDTDGSLACDLTIWRLAAEAWEVMSGRRQDIADLLAAARTVSGARASDLSDANVIYAVQGPGTLAALEGLADTSALASIGYFKHASATVAGLSCHVGRLGYTGEQGFEIVAPKEAGEQLWHALAARARPAGFAAADRLRIEAGFILFANELLVPVTPAEAGVGAFGGPTAADATSQVALVCLTAAPRDIDIPWQPRRELARPAREGEVTITSACRSPLAPGVLLLGFARSADLAAGAPLFDGAGEFAGLARVPLPCYDPQKRRPRAPMVRSPAAP